MTVLLANTVDILCTIHEAFWMWHFVELLYERRKWKNAQGWKRLLLPGVQVTLFVLTVFALNQMVLTSPYTVLILTVECILAACIFWKCDILNAVAVVGVYFFLLSTVGMIQISLTGIIGGDALIRQTTSEQGWLRIIYITFNELMWCGLNMLVYRWLRSKVMKGAYIKSLACVAATGLIGFLFICRQMLERFSGYINAVWYLFMIVEFGGGLIVYYIAKTKRMDERLYQLNMQNKILEKNYLQISEFYRSNAKLYHDMRHHLSVICYILEEGEIEQAKQYVESLKNMEGSLIVKKRTGIDVIDVVLSELERQAAGKGIFVSIKSHILAQDIKVEQRDLCALLANLMENAIEAAQKEIKVVIKKVQGMLLICVQNDCRQTPIMKNRKFQTTKKDKKIMDGGRKA